MGHKKVLTISSYQPRNPVIPCLTTFLPGESLMVPIRHLGLHQSYVVAGLEKGGIASSGTCYICLDGHILPLELTGLQELAAEVE